MKAARIHEYGGPVRVEEAPRPSPGPGDLLVQVRAASVNPVDFKIRDGKLKALVRYRMPLTLGNDLSGTVVAVGAGVSAFKPGDEIFARLDKVRIGAFAELALVRETAAARKPARLSHVEAASLPLVGLTAWQAMVDIARLQPGARILIHAGSGGVGTFAIQLGKHLGCWVATTAGARNLELVRKLGADQAIDYRAQQFDEVLDGLDFVLDTQGGATLHRSFAVVKPGGCIVSIGGLPDAKFARSWGLNPFLVLALGFLARKETRLARQRGVRYEYLFMHASGTELSRIAELVEGGVIQPVIDRTFPLDQVREALAWCESGRATGKVVLST
jgi:NADPH:quinone reductase-like Zn-dependent oxidoreductase